MKKITLFTILFLSFSNIFSQDITGEWNGALNVQSMELPLVFHIEKTGSGFSSKMDSPKQNVFGIPMSSTIFENDSLFISSQIGISYNALFSEENGFTGEFHQNGMTLVLNLTREQKTAETSIKSEKPLPYLSEEIQFENTKAEINLAGTLTLPKENGKFPAVVLITGSGAQTRKGNPAFSELADYLTRNKIAVLHVDDRGVGGSEGDPFTATSADFATDVKAAVDYLQTRKEINSKQIGLIGHSEGGMIAPMLSSKSDEVAFLVLMAAPGLPGDDLLLMQNRALGNASGMNEIQLEEASKTNRTIYDIILNSPQDSLKTNLTTYLKTFNPNLTDTQMEAEVQKMTYPWMKFFLEYDPRPALEQTTIPVLAINGEKDLQVLAEENLNAIETALKKGGNKNVTIKTLPNLNHLFQTCETGLPSEYNLDQGFSPETMETILNWIKERTK